MESKLLSGILINNTSDHLPVFLIRESDYKKGEINGNDI